jgi:hypothetical protein
MSNLHSSLQHKIPLSLDPTFQVYFNFICTNNTSIAPHHRLSLPKPKLSIPEKQRKFKVSKSPSPKAISQLKLPSCYLRQDHGLLESRGDGSEKRKIREARRPVVVGSYLSNKIPTLKIPIRGLVGRTG